MTKPWLLKVLLLLSFFGNSTVRAGIYDLPELEDKSPRSRRAGVSGKLLATSGVTQVEGAAGGGIVPWALMAGYGTKEQTGGSAFYTHLNTNDYRLNLAGVALTFYDRLELSFAHQAFNLVGTVFPGNTIKQEVFAGKLKLWGDAIFAQDSFLPQTAIGVQYKRNKDFNFIPRAIGAKSDHGIDYYIAFTKLYLGALAGRNLLLNATARGTKANQLGLLGFAGDKNEHYQIRFEGSIGVLLNEQTAVGMEYRNKPNNLSSFKEEDWGDVFVAYFPNKNLSLTIAYAKLGKIAGKDQNGFYLSLQTGF